MQVNSIPDRAARKQAELCSEIIREVVDKVSTGVPADNELRDLYIRHREF
ncbi:MAG: hypothetical protein GX811_09055, partial [Lentisphaerae bacterium]|nr:hypothetical protein [Lentisphaerota bacterium]